MVFGGAVAMIRRGAKVAASTAQRRLLISLEIPSKDRAHPWFLHWMAAQARAQSMRERGLLGKQKKEGLVDFLGLRDRSGDRRALPSKRDKVDDPLVIASSGSSVSPVRILSHELSVETNYTHMPRLRHQMHKPPSVVRLAFRWYPVQERTGSDTVEFG